MQTNTSTHISPDHIPPQPSPGPSTTLEPRGPETRTSTQNFQSAEILPKVPKPRQHLRDSTYAQKAATLPFPQTTVATAKQPRQQIRPSVKIDTRLFIRLGPNHPARTAGSFAVLTALKRQLGTHSSLLKEVQATKTGFALCTNSDTDLTALEKHSDIITNTIQDCTIEKQQQWTTYRLDYVPRTVTILNDHNQISINTVSKDILYEAIKDSTTLDLIQAVESRMSIDSGLHNTTWFISFKTENHTSTLPKTLRILGTTVYSTLIVSKPKTIQCTRCFQWHNTRACSRPERCRICGTTKHTEKDHSTKCNTAHTCPARCLHCGGPHPADDPHCLLRLTYKGPKTKSEKQAIQKTSKQTRIRACANAKCTRAPKPDSRMEEAPVPYTAPPRTPTTPTRSTLTPSVSAPPLSNRFNRFVTLETSPLPSPFNV